MKRITFITIATALILGSCGVPQEDFDKLQSDNNDLKQQLEECQFGAGKLLSQAKAFFENKEFEKCKKEINVLLEKHSGSSEAKIGKELIEKVNIEIKKLAEAKKKEKAEKERKEKQRLANATKKMKTSEAARILAESGANIKEYQTRIVDEMNFTGNKRREALNMLQKFNDERQDIFAKYELEKSKVVKENDTSRQQRERNEINEISKHQEKLEASFIKMGAKFGSGGIGYDYFGKQLAYASQELRKMNDGLTDNAAYYDYYTDVITDGTVTMTAEQLKALAAQAKALAEAEKAALIKKAILDNWLKQKENFNKK